MREKERHTDKTTRRTEMKGRGQTEKDRQAERSKDANIQRQQ